MPKFKYKIRKRQDSNTSTGSRWAFSERDLKDELLGEGVVDVLAIEELPPEAATIPQLDYLARLGVNIPQSLSKVEASDLIESKLSNRPPASARDQGLAEYYRIEASRFVSAAEISKRICQKMADNNDHIGLAQWFVFRVYRNAFDRMAGPGIEHPADERFADIGKRIAANARLMRSLRRQAQQSTTGFRWFGEFHSHMGDSDQTIVYLEAIKLLRAAGLVATGGKPLSHPSPRIKSEVRTSPSITQTEESYPHLKKQDASSGCWPTILGAMVVLALLWLIF